MIGGYFVCDSLFSQIKLKCDLAKAPNQMASGSWLMSLHFIMIHLQPHTFAKQNIRTHLKRENEKKQSSYAIGGICERFTHSRQKQYDSLIKLRRKCSHGCVFILNAAFAYFFHLFSLIFFRPDFLLFVTFFSVSNRWITLQSAYDSIPWAVLYYYFTGKKLLHENSCKQKKWSCMRKQ